MSTFQPEFDEYYVKDLNEYNNTILTLLEDYSEIYFRGVNQARFNLSPSISRNMPPGFTVNKELELFAAFRRRIAMYKSETYREYTGTFSNQDMETLAIAQHHSLKTRLLDWSTNPLASLWFACSEPTSPDPDPYCVIWVLTAPKKRSVRDDFFKTDKQILDFEKQFKEQETFMYLPNIVNPRIRSQSGLFSVHHYIEEDRKFVSLEENKTFFPHKFDDNLDYNVDIHWNLIKVLINRVRYGSDILRNLNKFDVHEETIYPSLQEAGKRLNFDYGNGWVY